jgi:hypothetical protein
MEFSNKITHFCFVCAVTEISSATFQRQCVRWEVNFLRMKHSSSLPVLKQLTTLMCRTNLINVVTMCSIITTSDINELE